MLCVIVLMGYFLFVGFSIFDVLFESIYMYLVLFIRIFVNIIMYLLVLCIFKQVFIKNFNFNILRIVVMFLKLDFKYIDSIYVYI